VQAMNTKKTDIKCDLMIIGTGLSGMAAALFAARSGIDAIQAGTTGQLGFASGLIDLLGVHPVADSALVRSPWEGLEQLRLDMPAHPFARMSVPDIRSALEDFLGFLGQCGYPHYFHLKNNVEMMTPAGTVKPTYALPHTMAEAPACISGRRPTLIVDFEGLKGFSARQLVFASVSRSHLRPQRIVFPGSSGELYAEPLARSLDVAQNRHKLRDAVAPYLADAEAVGFPAILGVYRTLDVLADLSRDLGVPVFEIPTMLPSVPGLRLREIFEQQLPAEGVQMLRHTQVQSVGRTPDGCWLFSAGNGYAKYRIQARAAILCSGRFFGKGLHADRHGIRETIFDLPVAQPPARELWHHKDFLHPQGHPVNRSGIEIDDSFRPVDEKGRSVYPDLFAAGTLLAHQDWMRQKCGSGLAIATAYGAVNACKQFLTDRYYANNCITRHK